ncbi:hypothetical protein H4R33_000909 [Dimargaris cristalligena]|nr:hypothetical protein H4R33_000909 [Dimargaris cristalligena]
MKPYLLSVTLLGLAVVHHVSSRPQPVNDSKESGSGVFNGVEDSQPNDKLVDSASTYDIEVKNYPNKMSILMPLPPELIENTLTYLPYKDRVQMSGVNQNLNKIVKYHPESLAFIESEKLIRYLSGLVLERGQISLSRFRVLFPMQPMDAIMAYFWKKLGGHYPGWWEYPSKEAYTNGKVEPSDISNYIKLVPIEEQWAYLDYTRLSDTHKRVLFPMLYLLPNLTTAEIIKLFTLVDSLCTNNLSVEEVEEAYKDEPILATFPSSFQQWWDNDLITTHLIQFVASVSTVLATTGRIAELLKLYKDTGFTGILQPGTSRSIALFLLEYGDFGPEEDAKLASHVNLNCGYANVLGFTIAQAKCMRHDRNRSMDQFVLVDVTAGGFVYPHRDPQGNPKLAIRVRRSTAIKLLEANDQEVDDSLWLNNNILLDRLHAIKFRTGFPPPRIIPRQM